jgi:hypothetical protein
MAWRKFVVQARVKDWPEAISDMCGTCEDKLIARLWHPEDVVQSQLVRKERLNRAT